MWSMTKEPMAHIALHLPVSVKARVEEWRRAQPAIPTWTAAAQHLLVLGLDVEAAKAAKATAKTERKAKK
jgi:hypothetical protein